MSAMATCMVTCGRGLDDFVWHEILEKIPGAVDLRHLGEGKLAFNICQAVCTTDSGLTLEQNCVADKGNLDNVGSIEAKGEYNVISTTSKELNSREEIIDKQEVTLNTVLKPPEICTEEEDQWLAAVSNIFKLKLVERVFTLLHCEDIGEFSSSRRHQCCVTMFISSLIPHNSLLTTFFLFLLSFP